MLIVPHYNQSGPHARHAGATRREQCIPHTPMVTCMEPECVSDIPHLQGKYSSGRVTMGIAAYPLLGGGFPSPLSSHTLSSQPPYTTHNLNAPTAYLSMMPCHLNDISMYVYENSVCENSPYSPPAPPPPNPAV